MEILRRTPAFAVLISLSGGLLFYERAGTSAFIIFVPLIFICVSFLTYENNLPSQWKIFLTGLGLVLIFSLRIYFALSAPDMPEENFINETGVITLLRTWGKNYAAVIDTEKHGKLATYLHFAELTEGTRIKFDGSAQKLKNSNKLGEFSEKNYWKARGVNSRVKIKNIKKLPEKFNLYLLRNKLSRFLSIKIPKLTGGYLKAAWLGEHTEELDNQHRKGGTSHLLAVSGFHVGIAVLIAGIFFGKNFLILSLSMWVYILLTGAAPSAARSGLMIQIGLSALLIGRRVNGVNAVSVSGIILLLFRPFLFWDIGWRLSVISALTVTMMPPKKFNSFLIGPAVTMATFPQVISTFGTMPYAGLLINIFAPFYFSFAFILASVFVFLSLIKFPFADNFMFSIEGIFVLWERTANFITNLIPYSMHYNIFTIILWTCAFIFLVCRYFNFSAKRTLLIMTLGIFPVYILF